MQRHAFRILALVFVFCLTFGVAFAKERVARTPEQLYQTMMLQLDELEQRVPKAQSEIFQLRASIAELYSHVTNGDLTDPILDDGSLMSADHEKGSDLYDSCQGLEDDALKNQLLKLIKNHVSVGYQRAQDLVFTELDNYDGYVECVYTGRKLQTNCEPPATNMNIEHSWPQSHGATGIAKCDLHHLFPSDSKANGIRGNHPFGYVSNPEWEQGGSKSDGNVFEVRPEQRGNTARALFYFSVRYNMRSTHQKKRFCVNGTNRILSTLKKEPAMTG
ncbi:MAG: hypothetical protein Kow0029_25000 [Candidatus Rifleibacteriota bacterium]